MTDIKIKSIKDFGDGELTVEIVCQFTVFAPILDRANVLNNLKEDVEGLVDKYAI